MSRRRRRRSRARFSAPASRSLGLDLHLHSTRSDGELAPEAVLEGCAKRGLGIIAITDHDVPPALPSGAHQVGERSIHVVHGVELSGTLPAIGEAEATELHILGYFPGEMPDGFLRLLQGRARSRADRYEQARKSLGLPGVQEADAEARAGRRALTRHHLARALVHAGHAASVDHAFRQYCGRSHGHVPPVDFTAREAIAAIRDAGGLAVWAHPRVRLAAVRLPTLVGWGLEGMECVRPTLGASAQATLLQLAHQHGLIPTGGSDFHGWGRRRLGAFRFRAQLAAPFLDRLGLAAQQPAG